MKVVDVMTRRVITVTPNASILQCGAATDPAKQDQWLPVVDEDG